MSHKSEIFHGTVLSGEDKGRILSPELAREMAYASKPILETRMAEGYIAAENLFYDLGYSETRNDLGYDIEEIPAKRVYDQFMKQQRGLARNAIENSRKWTAVNKPSSAGLPSLGKR